MMLRSERSINLWVWLHVRCQYQSCYHRKEHLKEHMFYQHILRKFSVIARWRRPRVMCRTTEASTHALLSSSITVGFWIQPIVSSMPRLAMISDLSVWLKALISDSALDVDTLPWSVEHQQMREPPRYPKYDVWEYKLSGLPAKSASHWKRSWSQSVIVCISWGPSCVSNSIRSALEFLTYRKRCLAK